MATAEPMPSFSATATVLQRNGLGVASLVLGVASLVAVGSFVLFPFALVGGAVGAVLGVLGLLRAARGEASNRGQAVAGLVCSFVALALAIVLTVRVGTWANDNRTALTDLGNCLAKAQNGTAAGTCFGQFATDVRD
jgi:uncharacterized membrane protein